MNDAALSALFGSARIQSITTGSATQNANQVPRELANVSVGGLIKGFVVNRDRDNNPILRTQQGDVLVKSDLFLKTGSEVVIRVEQSRARILSVNGESIQQIQHRHEREAAGNSQDRVLQPSMMAPRSESQVAESVTNKAQFLAETKLMREMLQLDAVLLKPSASSAQPAMQQTMASILKLSPNAIHLLEQGASLQFRVVGSDLHIKLPAAVTTAPATVSTANPSQPAQATPAINTAAVASPATATVNTTQPVHTLYNLYNKLVRTTPIPSALTAPPAPTATPAPAATTAIANNIATQTIATSMSSLVTADDVVPSPATVTAPASAPLAGGAPATAPSGTAAASGTLTPATTPASITGAVTTPAVTTGATPATQAAATLLTPANTATASATPIASGIAAPLTPATVTPAGQPAGVTPAPGTITARVIGVEPTGETIVRTPIGTVKLFTGSAPPLHSVLQLQLVVSPSVHGQSTLPPPSPVSSALVTFAALSHDWAALDEAYQLIQQAAPHLTREFTSRIPNTKSALVNNVLFFISALGSSNVRHWLGNSTAEMLEEKSPGLLNRLMADFSGIRGVLRDQPDQPWQMLPFPIMHEKELNQARLFVRRDDSSKPAEESAGTRFIVELSMSEMGEIQLDGLVQKRGAQTQFDLVLRSEHPFPDSMQSDIQQLFTTAAGATGYTGSLRFQPDPARFIMPLAESHRPSGTDTGSIIA